MLFRSEQWERRLKVGYPAIPGTAIVIDGASVGEGNMPGLCVLFTTTRGICLGGPEGYFKNLTEKKLVYPVARYGAAVMSDTRYVVTMES